MPATPGGPAAPRRRAAPLVALGLVACAAAILAWQGCGGEAGDASGAASRRGAAADSSASGSAGAGRDAPATSPPAERRQAAERAAPRAARPRDAGMTVRVAWPDGRPAAGCRVTVSSAADPSREERRETGSDGAARFDAPPPAPLLVRWAPLSVWAPPGDGARVVRDGVRWVRTVRDLDIALGFDLPLGGTVTDAAGAAVAGVVLGVEAADPAPFSQVVPENDSTRTRIASSRGEFAFTVPRGRWWITVADSFQRGDPDTERFGPFDAGRTDLRIVAGPRDDRPGTARITGTARWPDGRPASGWVWFLRASPGGTRPDRTPHAPAAQPEFRSSALVAGARYDVVLRDDGGGRMGQGWAVVRDVAAGTSGLALTAAPPRSVSGTVLDTEGRPIEGVVVTATLRPEVTIDPFDLKATSDAAGRFTIHVVPPFAVRLVAGGAGTDWWAHDPPVVPEGPAEGVVVRVARTVHVAGRLVFEDGTPVQGGGVVCGGRSCGVDREGRFRASRCLPGPVHLGWTPSPGFVTDFDVEIATPAFIADPLVLALVPIGLGVVTAPCEDAELTVPLPE